MSERSYHGAGTKEGRKEMFYIYIYMIVCVRVRAYVCANKCRDKHKGLYVAGYFVAGHSPVLRPPPRAGPRGEGPVLGDPLHGHAQGVRLPARRRVRQRQHDAERHRHIATAVL